MNPLGSWDDFTMTSIPYGYEVTATPLQVLCAYAAVANRGMMMKPLLVKRIETADGDVLEERRPQELRRVCSEKTAKRLTELMKWVVEKGTGVAVAIPSYDIAGKTGTAHKLMDKKYSKYNYVSSFVGFVPADDPRFAIYVCLDDPRGLYWGGYTAGPVFKEVAKRVLAYALVPPKEGFLEAADPVHTVPSFVGLTREQSKRVAERAGLRLKFNGRGGRVTAQSDKFGTRLDSREKNRNIRLMLGEFETFTGGKGVMPDLRGKTKRQALSLLAPLGVKVNFKGKGIILSQYPSPGTVVSGGILCLVNCEMPAAFVPKGTEGKGGPT